MNATTVLSCAHRGAPNGRVLISSTTRSKRPPRCCTDCGRARAHRGGSRRHARFPRHRRSRGPVVPRRPSSRASPGDRRQPTRARNAVGPDLGAAGTRVLEILPSADQDVHATSNATTGSLAGTAMFVLSPAPAAGASSTRVHTRASRGTCARPPASRPWCGPRRGTISPGARRSRRAACGGRARGSSTSSAKPLARPRQRLDERFPVEHLGAALGVADLETEQHPNHAAVAAAHGAARERHVDGRAFGVLARDRSPHVRPVARANEPGQHLGIKVAVAIDEADEPAPSPTEPAPHHRTLALVDRREVDDDLRWTVVQRRARNRPRNRRPRRVPRR